MIDMLLIHGTIVTMDKERRIIEDGAIALDGTRIKAIGNSEDLLKEYHNAKKIIDCKNKLILPGFIDVHGHAGHCMFKALAYDSVSYWMPIMTETYHNNTTDEFWYKEGKLAALERLKFGVTCGLSVISNSQRSDDPIFSINHAKGYADVGIREIIAVGPSNPPYPRRFSRIVNGKKIERLVTFDEMLEGAEEAIKATNHSYEDTIRAFIAPFVLVTSVNQSSLTVPDVATNLTKHDRYMMQKVREIAKKYNTRIHTEAFGGMIRLAATDENALLGPDIHIQHCTGISIDEAIILAETGTHVSSAPGAGQLINRCPVPELIELGANVAISTDGTSPAVSFDMLNAARKTQLVHQGALQDRYYLPPGKLLEMITIDAAKAIGWDDEIGSLEVGKKADVITIDMHQAHLSPNFMPVHKLILYASGQDVDNVIVNGKLLMKDRKVMSVNEYDIIEEAQEEAFATIDRAGLRKYMEPCDTFWGSTRMYMNENRYEKKE